MEETEAMEIMICLVIWAFITLFLLAAIFSLLLYAWAIFDAATSRTR